MVNVFFFKQKTAYEMRISDWSSDVCSSDLLRRSQDRIDRHENGAGQRGAEEGGNRLHALVEPDAEALATHDLQRRQPGSVRFSRVPQRAVGEALVLQDKGRRLQIGRAHV